MLALLALQYLLGAAAYLWPGMSPARKRALGPLHIYLGKAVFLAGMATMAVSGRTPGLPAACCKVAAGSRRGQLLCSKWYPAPSASP